MQLGIVPDGSAYRTGIINCLHNFAGSEKHFGQYLMVHRTGAT